MRLAGSAKEEWRDCQTAATIPPSLHTIVPSTSKPNLGHIRLRLTRETNVLKCLVNTFGQDKPIISLLLDITDKDGLVIGDAGFLVKVIQ